LKISKEVEEIKISTKAFSEDVMLNFDDKQIKIEELFDHFQKKDEIV
jgi:peptide methionine sulfoxide reductase MsrA